MNAPSLENFKPKSFWEKKEGTAGMLFAAVGVVGGGWLLYKFLPFVNFILENSIRMVISGVVLAGLLYMIFDPRIRNLAFFAYRSFCRMITSIFVTVDPIGIVEEYIDQLKKYRRDIEKQIEILKGQVNGLKKEIQTNMNAMQQNLQMVNAAKKSQDPSKYALNVKLAARETGRLQNTNKTFSDLLKKMEWLYERLKKVADASDFWIADTESEVKIKKKELKVVSTGNNAIKSAMKIINPKDDKKALFDMAMEYMAEDIANKVGNIERFLEVSEQFMNSVDLQNGVFEEEGWALLEELEKNTTDEILLSDGKKLVLEQKNNQVKVGIEDQAQSQVKEQVPNSYSKYFN